MLTDYTRLQTRLNTLNPGADRDSFRNAPVFDFMNPSERINQVILTNLYNDQPFKAIPRVDRCTTCHLGIDQKAYQDAPQPFKTHPNLDLYLSFRLAASDGNVRLHDLPRRSRSRDEFPECRPHAAQRRTAEGMAEEVRLA